MNSRGVPEINSYTLLAALKSEILSINIKAFSVPRALMADDSISQISRSILVENANSNVINSYRVVVDILASSGPFGGISLQILYTIVDRVPSQCVYPLLVHSYARELLSLPEAISPHSVYSHTENPPASDNQNDLRVSSFPRMFFQWLVRDKTSPMSR